VLEGSLRPAVHFRFFLSALRWGPGALDQEIDQGAWRAARAAPACRICFDALPSHVGVNLGSSCKEVAAL
jgi:putative AlgH/UPF0301 family transcriptional regulator